MERMNSSGAAAGAGRSRMLAAGILYICTAGIIVFLHYSSLLYGMGLPLSNIMMLTSILGVLALALTIAVIVLLFSVGIQLRRTPILVAGILALASIVATHVLTMVWVAFEVPLVNHFLAAGLGSAVVGPIPAEFYAMSFTNGLVVSLPSSAFPVLISVCLLLDALRNETNRPIPVVAIVLAGTAVGYVIVQVSLLWFGISWGFTIPFSQAATVMWGVYFLVARHSLAN
ncbi:MAG: hypothetical protein JW839_09880 [Candidatus Lokiarchaeota archaeon]|nr:hypothetical protein [Candidatus Lokiarchaeota archaeon]